jgi:hypothetical protein
MMRGSREKCTAIGTRGEARASDAGEVTGACGGCAGEQKEMRP